MICSRRTETEDPFDSVMRKAAETSVTVFPSFGLIYFISHLHCIERCYSLFYLCFLQELLMMNHLFKSTTGMLPSQVRMQTRKFMKLYCFKFMC